MKAAAVGLKAERMQLGKLQRSCAMARQNENGNRRQLRLLSALLIAGALAGGAGIILYRTALPTVRAARLPDQSHVWVRSGSSIRVAPDFEITRSIEMSGEILIRVAAGARPLRIRSPLMIVTVQGPAVLAVTSFPREIGARVEVLEGEIDVDRAYQSRWHESAHVPAGETGLIARQLDILEHDPTQKRDIPSWIRRYWRPVANR
jgi:ferric-dicitrate binding protein FerR (iron transport regulator)